MFVDDVDNFVGAGVDLKLIRSEERASEGRALGRNRLSWR
jgi:hypothetical protein